MNLADSIRPKEHGNVLFLIVIAVALFAALSYAVTSSTRSGGASISSESAQLEASNAVNYSTYINSTITRLILSGCLDTSISFENSVVTGYTNPNSPASKECNIFDAFGGGASFQKPSFKSLDSSFSASGSFGEWNFNHRYCIYEIGTGSSGTCDASQADIVAFLPYIKLEICEAINQQGGLSLNPIPTQGFELYKFIGSYVSPSSFNSVFKSKNMGCFRASSGTAAGSYVFYHVLRPR